MNPEENPQSPLKQIRTFQGDIAEALKRQRESLVSIQRAEQMKRGSVPQDSTSSSAGKSRKEFFYLLLGSAALLVLGGVGTWYAYTAYVEKTITPVIAALPNKFFKTESEENLAIATTTKRSVFIDIVSKAETSENTTGLKQIIFKINGNTAELISTDEFFRILESRAPGSLVRALDKNFMYGYGGEPAGSFLVFRLKSFENAFAGALVWEKYMLEDIGPLFPSAKNDPTSTSTPSSTFADFTDRNKDVRMLTRDDKPILVYSFLDNQMLIIAENLDMLRTIIERLTREKLSR